MSSRRFIALGIGGFVLLVAAALWLLLRPPTGSAALARSMSASNPALDVRFSYDPAVFQPQPYDPHAEFPLRLDAADWSFYGKRLRGAGSLLKREAAPEVYGFVTESFSSVYREFYRLELASKSEFDKVPLGRQQAVRQRLQLRLTAQSQGWPQYFPRSVTAGLAPSLVPLNEQAERTFALPGFERDPQEQAPPPQPAPTAFLYVWALFEDEDLYLFQAVAAHELDDEALLQAEQLIGRLEFGAVRGAPAAQ